MGEFLIQDTTANELVEIAREMNGTTEKIKGSDVVMKIREGMNRHVDTATITDWSYYFYNGMRFNFFEKCNMNSGKKYENCFYNCTELIDAGTIDLSNIPDDTTGNCRNMFSGCTNLVSVTLKTNSIYSSNFPRAFYNATALTDLTIEGTINVDSDSLNVAYSPILTVESLLGILNALEDNSEKPNKYTVYLGGTNLAKLTDEQKQIAEDKNIALQ